MITYNVDGVKMPKICSILMLKLMKKLNALKNFKKRVYL